MIKILFSGLNFQDSDFVNTIYEEGFLRPVEDFIIPISSVWNGETYPVQFLVYDTYAFNVKMRDSEYLSFQKIQYAPSINIYINETPYLVKIVEFTAEPYLNEFWNINIKVRLLNTKKVENIILSSIEDIFTIEPDPVNYNINLPILVNTDLEQNLIDNFKDNISDFRKDSNYYSIRFYLLRSEISGFITQLKSVSSISTDAIYYSSVAYRDYEMQKQEVGDDLFQIDLKLFTDINIIT